MGKENLQFKVQSGAPVEVHVTYEGKAYVLKLGLAVMGVQATGLKSPDGKPMFNVNAAPSMSVEEKSS